MRLSVTFQEKIRDSIRAGPIQGNTIRRIVGCGEMYVSLSSATFDVDTYVELFTASIDGVSHRMYRKIS